MSVDLLRTLGVLAEAPSAACAPLSEALGLGSPPSVAEHADLFAFNVYPYASVYLGPEGQMGGEARSRIVGFWRAVGLEVPSEPDHLTSLLGLVASLQAQADAEGDPSRAVLLGEAATACLFEHLLPWVNSFLRAARLHGSPYYSRWAEMTSRVIAAELASRNVPSDRVPVHLTETTPLNPPAESGGAAFLDQLLAPVRTGMVLSRQDLARLGREVGLGVRIGERRYMLEAYLGQDPVATLSWLAQHAGSWSERADESVLAVRRFWADRARRTARLLEEAATQASESVPGFAAPAHPV